MSRQIDPAKRQHIVRSAIEVFGERGYAQTTVRHIAHRAGVATGTVYIYFPDKDTLFRSAFEESWEAFRVGMEHIMSASDNPQVNVRNLIDFGIDLLAQLHPLVRGMFTQANLMDIISPRLDQLAAHFGDLFGEVRGLRLAGVPSIAAPAGGGPDHGCAAAATPDTDLRRFMLRTIISGILATVAVTPHERLEECIQTMKEQLRKSIQWTGAEVER